MSIIASVTVPSQSFALHETLSTAPDTSIEAERLATHSTEEVLPFLWTTGGDAVSFHEAIQDDPTVVTATIVEETDESRLYQITWDEAFIDFINEIIDQHATILEAKATNTSWQLQLRFTEEHLVSSFQDHFTERGYEFEVNQLYSPTSSRQREYGLTPEQYDTLVTAVQKGYFNIPRSITNTELADTLGISSNATSQRIRRASTNLIQNTLIIGTDEESTSFPD